MPNRYIPDVVRELSELWGDKKPDPEELLKLARALNEIPHWFVADYEERPSRQPGKVERSLVPGTLKDLGPVSPEEMRRILSSASNVS